MTSEVVIDVQQKDISIALMEDKQLVEYQNEPREASFSVGNIYIAKVKKLMPGLNACFVDVGYERDAFLHYLDLGSHFNSYQKYLKQVQSDRKKLFPFSKASKMPELEKDGSIQNVLKGKPDEIKKRYFRDENYMRAWIEAVNRLIVRWGQIRDSINQI